VFSRHDRYVSERQTDPFEVTVGGVAAAGTENPSADGVGVLELSSVATDAAGFLSIFERVSRPGITGAVVTTSGFRGGACLILDLVTRCGGVSTISLSSSSSSSGALAVTADTPALSCG